MTKVLIAHGDSTASRALTDGLVAGGHEVCLAVDALQVLPVARREQPAVVLLDTALPGGRGSVIVERLKTNATTAAIPVIAMAEPSATASSELMRSGATTILPKPVSVPTALASVGTALADPTAPAAPPSVLERPERLEALRASGLLDSPVDEEFERFTRLATRLLGVPVALISLVDVDRQFFKSSVGLNEPWESNRQTPLSHSFCQFAVAFREPLLIEDARANPLVAASRGVTELGVIAYAGIPLITAEDEAIGSLCAIDSQPRAWPEEDVRALRDLAAILMTQVDLRRRLTAAG